VGWRSRGRKAVAGAVGVALALSVAGCDPRLRVTRLTPASGRGPGHEVATPEDPLRVLLLGDGVMFDAEPGLIAGLESTGRVAVAPGSMWGYGLTHPEVADFRVDWRARVAAAQPDLVVVLVGPWDMREALGPLDAAWAAAYGALLDEAVGVLRAGGSEVWWLPMLPEPGDEREARIRTYDAAIAALDGRHPTVVSPDVHAAFLGPDGRYTDGPDGRRWRKPDGEHLCPDGVVHLLDALRPALADRFGIDPPRTYEQGDWRADLRYRWQATNAC
jgi:hypothetical protein